MNVKIVFILTFGLILFSACGSSDKSSVPDINTTAPDSNTTEPDTNTTIPVSTLIMHNGTSYGFVTSPYTGKIWLDRNLGAARVCESFNDTACYGDYYQWGRNADGHEDSGSATTFTQATDVATVGHSDFIMSEDENFYDWAKAVDETGATRQENWSKTDGSSVCPAGFRVPNITELKAETLDNDVTNRDTAFSNFLKLPLPGYRFYTSGDLFYIDSSSYMWASSVGGTSLSNGIGFSSDFAGGFDADRAFGFSVRCLRD